jgi:hypothetical protein
MSIDALHSHRSVNANASVLGMSDLSNFLASFAYFWTLWQDESHAVMLFRIKDWELYMKPESVAVSDGLTFYCVLLFGVWMKFIDAIVSQYYLQDWRFKCELQSLGTAWHFTHRTAPIFSVLFHKMIPKVLKFTSYFLLSHCGGWLVSNTALWHIVICFLTLTGISALLPFRRKLCYRFSLPLNIH